MSHKGMQMALGVVVTIVVLVVVSLAVITISTNSTGQLGADTEAHQDQTNCDIAIKSACASQSKSRGDSLDPVTESVRQSCDGITTTYTC